MFLEAKTKEELTVLAEAYSKYNLEQIADLNRKIEAATNKRMDFGIVLTGLIDQANKQQAFEVSAKLARVKSIFKLFIETLTKNNKK